jgi:hypothetical protein
MEANMKALRLVLIVFLFTQITATLGNAVPIKYNGHYYDVITNLTTNNWITWSEARTAAEILSYSGVQGHLATINSAEENIALYQAFGFTGLDNLWLGGYQPQGSEEPAGGWTWVTGELFTFTNWPSTEPSNTNGNENFLVYAWSPNAYGVQWNDAADGQARGYVVEYESGPDPSHVPEPSTMLLLGSGLVGLVAFRKRFKRA